MDKKIKVGLIGLGTVGSGVFKTLRNFNEIEVSKIAVKNINKKRDIEGLETRCSRIMLMKLLIIPKLI